MRRTTALIAAAALALTATACGGDSDTRTITKAEVEKAGKAWPFTSDKAQLACDKQAVTVKIDGKVYALNGIAVGRKAGADLDPVWAADPNLPDGLKVNAGDVTAMGLELCK